MSALTDGVSIREFARLDGCDDKLVRRAISAGRLVTLPDGKLNPALAGSGWRKSNRRADSGADKVADKPRVSAQPEVSADADVVLDPTVAARLATGTVELVEAEKIKANALALKHLLAARREAGELVEMEVAHAVLFETMRSVRDAFLGWPSRVGPLMAADLGVSVERMVEALSVHVHQQLEDLGEPEADFKA